METVSYDIIVVGAGPAGSFAARYAAKAGWGVLLVDQNEFPRDKVCGDGLNPRSCFLLAEADIDARRLEQIGGVRIRGYRKFLHDVVTEEFIVPRAGWADHAYGVPRPKLDGLLLEEALSSGAEWLGGFRVREIKVDGQKQRVVVRGERLGRATVAGAKLAIIAAGASAAFYRELGAAPDRTQGAIAGGLRQYFRVPAALPDMFNFYYFPTIPEGYAWIFPVGGDLVNVGIWSRDSSGEIRRLRDLFSAFIHDASRQGILSGAEALGQPRGALMRPSLSACVVGDRLLWAGEGAGLMHRETGQGISYALESGRQAALIADMALRDDLKEAELLRGYASWMHGTFGEELLSWRRTK